MSAMNSDIPLAERMRPGSADDYIGQQHLLGSGGPIRIMCDSGIMPSMIFWGPPGTGKTTLALLLAEIFKRPFYQLSAINSGVKDIREVIEKADRQGLFSGNGKPVLFIDEIHRFSKSQQDSLLGAVEKGIITLIGATTENPSFEVIPALLSRCQVYVLKEHSVDELKQIAEQAIRKDTILSKLAIDIVEFDALIRISGGDARKLLNALELTVQVLNKGDKILITNQAVASAISENLARYDKSGEMHYDIISAFIKSLRGSDPNAAVYWLARMLSGGEDPKFIARRMLILAAEDIGPANPQAMVVANSCFQAIDVIGMPEGRILLSNTAVYLAVSAKSNSAYMAIEDAMKLVSDTGDLPVPLALRNAPTRLMKKLDYGKDYQYAHHFEGNFIEMEFMPEDLKGVGVYQPGDNRMENEIRDRMRRMWGGKYGY